jgi:hypothetical protein
VGAKRILFYIYFLFMPFTMFWQMAFNDKRLASRRANEVGEPAL